jgi:hypothetical protein
MKLKELFEGANNPVIIVDIQPEYSGYGQEKILQSKKFKNFIRRQNNILWFFNGEEVGSEDTKESIFNWLVENFDFDEEDLLKIEFREKGYGFLRSWMDADVDAGLIIKVIRRMVMTREYDSRDLNFEDFLTQEEIETLPESDMINIPDISIRELKRMNRAYLCGGGRHECLREITLLMSAFNIKYIEVNDFIYG